MVSYLTTLFLGKPPRGSLPVLGAHSLLVADNLPFISSPEPLGSQGQLIVYPSSRRPWSSVRCPSTIFKDRLLSKHLANQSQILSGASFGRGNESLYKWSRSHDQVGRHAHIW